MEPGQPPPMHSGRGRDPDPGGRRELRRPMGPANPDDLARQMAGFEPFGNGGGGGSYGYAANMVPQPAPNADGWSSGENQFDASSAMGAAYGGGAGAYAGYGGGQQQPHNSGGGYRPRNQGYRGHNPRGGGRGGGHYNNRGGGGFNNHYNPRPHQQQQYHNNSYGNRTWVAGGGGGGAGGQQHYMQHQQQQQHDANNMGQLNISASEFVPSNSNLSASAMEFVPRMTPRNTSTRAYDQPGAGASSGGPVGTPAEEVSAGIASLLYSPGKFEITAAHLTEALSATVSDLETMRSVVDQILSHCLSQANFRYTGARLLDHLAGTVVAPVGEEGQTLRDVVLGRCLEMHSGRAEAVAADPAKFRSQALFLADLFLQFGTYEGELKRRVWGLGEQTIDLVSTLVERQEAGGDAEDKEDFRAIAQALKMAGSALEQEERVNSNGNCPKMDGLMEKIDALAKKKAPTAKVPQHMVQMVGNLNDLRKSGWGAAAAASAAPAPAAASNSWSSGTAGGGPPSSASSAPPQQDFELTAEEEAFMKEHLGADILGEGEDGADEYDVDDEEDDMPPEIAAAYEEFIAENDHANIQ